VLECVGAARVDDETPAAAGERPAERESEPP
jgi:hypothetical protein